MTRTHFILPAIVACLLMQNSFASDTKTKIQSVLGDKKIVISDYDDQLKKVLVDGSKLYFATHDGRYLFAGPIIDTEQRINIISLHENQRRKTYLSTQPEAIFVSYPSSIPSKYSITVITDIDCPYCRKLHNHMNSFNQLGISVNYVMLPRTGVGSASHKKTVTALCSADPAASITNTMQNQNLPTLTCKNNVMSQHLKIANDLKITSTPTIILPNGQLKLGLVSPEKLLMLLESAG